MLSFYKKRIGIIFFIRIIIATTFFFQNCSKIPVSDVGSEFSALICNGAGSDMCAAEAAKCNFNGKELLDGQSANS